MVILNPSASVDVSLTSASSAINNTNFLQPNSFKIIIDRKNYPNLEFFCQSVQHPEMSSSPVEVPYQRISNIPMPGDKLTFSELTCMIILDENMNSYTEMYNWMQRMIQTPQKSAVNRSDELPPTHADITLSILSSANNQVRQVRYIDCIPVSLGTVSFESMASGDQFISYPASFRFSYFEFI
tara:strand:+ start:1050 stop:1598 length:549 start_codon:yes stop_codon:yes gene_type:complete